MAQTSFPFDMPMNRATVARLRAAPPSRLARDSAYATALDQIGFEIGSDHARHGLTPPLRHLHDGNPVRQGWGTGRAVFASRTLRATAPVRAWLALRLQAWQHGQAFEGVQLTPHFIAQIEASHCPVTRQALTQADNAVLARVHTHAAYAAGNLAQLSAQAAEAVADHNWRAAMAQAQSETPDTRLSAPEWQRLGVLKSFVTRLPHHVAAALPLSVLPPNRLRVLNPVQALQVMLTQLFTQPEYARRMLGLAALMPCHGSRDAFQLFMHTLLARRIAAGVAASPLHTRQAMEDSWADVLVNRRWQRLALRLSEAQCEQLLQRATRRGLAPEGSRWLSADAATEGWALASGGRVVVESATQSATAPCGEASAQLTM